MIHRPQLAGIQTATTHSIIHDGRQSCCRPALYAFCLLDEPCISHAYSKLTTITRTPVTAASLARRQSGGRNNVCKKGTLAAILTWFFFLSGGEHLPRARVPNRQLISGPEPILCLCRAHILPGCLAACLPAWASTLICTKTWVFPRSRRVPYLSRPVLTFAEMYVWCIWMWKWVWA